MDLPFGKNETYVASKTCHLAAKTQPSDMTNFAIATSSKSAYSETFVRMQMERLPCKLRIFGGPVASETSPGGIIAPIKNPRGLIETIVSAAKGDRTIAPRVAELSRRLKREGISVVLANFAPTACALLDSCQKAGVKLVPHFHGYDAHQLATIEKFEDRYKRLAANVSQVVVVSEKMKQAVIELGFAEDQIHVARCGVDPQHFAERPDQSNETPRFFAIGRFVDKKAPHLTLLAFHKALKDLPDAQLVLAGDGPLLETTHSIATALGIRNSVQLVGVVSPDRVADELRNCTAFLQHSVVPDFGTSAGDSEGTPVAVMEAMMTATPVIATRHAGIGEIIEHGKTGVLVAERDIDAMASEMVNIYQNPRSARELGLAARQYATKELSADIYIEKLSKILNLAAESH